MVIAKNVSDVLNLNQEHLTLKIFTCTFKKIKLRKTCQCGKQVKTKIFKCEKCEHFYCNCAMDGTVFIAGGGSSSKWVVCDAVLGAFLCFDCVR